MKKQLKKNRRYVLRAAAFAAALALTLPAAGGDFPDRPLRVVVTTAAGSGPDLTGRLIGAGLSKVLGQPVTIENRTGASGLIAFEHVAKAAPDGYTMILATPPFATIPAFVKAPRFDPVKDFSYVSQFTEAPLVLATYTDAPWSSYRELMDHARASKTGLNMGTGGPQTAAALLTHAISRKEGARFVQVAYSGGSPQTMVALLGKQIELAFFPEANVLAAGGRARIIATTGSRRLASAPAAPTFEELGLKNIPGTWYALLAPAGTPEPVVARLNRAVLEALRLPEVQAGIATAGQVAVGSTPKQTEALVLDQIKLFSTLARQAGLQPE